MSDLPTPSSTKPPSDLDPWDLWHDVVVEVKKRVMQPSFWQAVETVIPILIEGTTFVVGLPMAAGYYAGHLTGGENRNKLERIIEDLIGYRLTLRIIEGTEESDWEDVKHREGVAKKAQEAFRTRFEPGPKVEGEAGAAEGGVRSTALSWETLQERIYSMYSRAQGHHLPQGRARYLIAILPIIAEGNEKLVAASPQDKDRNDRSLARILDKIAGLVEMPSAVVALELMRYQTAVKKKTGS